MRQKETKGVRVVMKMNVEGIRGRGRPKKSWLEKRMMLAIGVCV